MMRDRGSVVLIENNKIALIKRTKDGSVYYVFPGGGIEDGETPEEATKREALEELGVEVKVKECIAKIIFNGTQYFYLVEIINGTFGTGKGAEFTKESKDRGTYLPMWIDIEMLSTINVVPKEVALNVKSIYLSQFCAHTITSYNPR
ncbi:DNA mismatch repair protein MutT [Solibacillus sp. R5-41]|uniref:NUDIX hydrolase n=1 Tax=Solibacillus sp. R5-41 TaxID=2048654 RepID=UPI000C126A38|nr:NUDIX domain-containing protein [Solibacillus sp. R5-41]ATP42473.1 DNA mismatch repair protein MutT [Solibacillus sp. R5-41]